MQSIRKTETQSINLFASDFVAVEMTDLDPANFTFATPARLNLGQIQEMVYTDDKDNIIGYAESDNGLVVRYDSVGRATSRTIALKDGFVAMASIKGTVKGVAQTVNERTVRYFDYTGCLAGEARLVNPNFVSYVDADGNSLGSAVIEAKRTLRVDADGNYKGRKVLRDQSGQWSALNDAWEVFATYSAAK